MKKFLIVLGMLTCLFGLTACGNSDNLSSTSTVPLMTEEEAEEEAEALIDQVDQIVSQGMAAYYAGDETSSAIFDSWASAMEEMGEYQGVIGHVVDISDDSVKIETEIKGSLRDGKVTIVLDVVDGNLGFSSFAVVANKTMGELMENAALNTLLGMGTVFAVLILIMIIIYCFKFVPAIERILSAFFGGIAKLFGRKKVDESEKEKSVDNTIAQIIENEELSDDTELVAVIAAAIAASEGAASTDGFVVRSIRRANTNKWQRA